MNWYKKASRTIEQHIEDVVNADLTSPIFITEDHEIIDGAHRTCKAYILGKNIEAIILTKEEINKALLPEDSDYVGQIYRDDDKNEYAVTTLIDLYRNKKAITMSPKDILNHSKDVWGKKVDVNYIIEQAHNNWYKKSKDKLWNAISNLKIDPNHPLPKKLCRINGVDILLVDGDNIKKNFSMDFVEGGSAMIYDFIPSEEIWVDANMSVKSIPHIIYHAFIERSLMQNQKMEYEKAHNIANQKEKEKI